MLQPSMHQSMHQFFGILAGGFASALLLIPSSPNPVQAADLTLPSGSLQATRFALDTEFFVVSPEENQADPNNQDDLAHGMALLFRLGDASDEEISSSDSEAMEYPLTLNLAGSVDKDWLADEINNCLAKASCSTVKLNYSDVSFYRGENDNALDSRLLTVHKANQRQNRFDYERYTPNNLPYLVLSSLGAKPSNGNATPSNAVSSSRSTSNPSTSSNPSKAGEKPAQSTERSTGSQSATSGSSDSIKNFAAQSDDIQPATKPEEWPLPLILVAAGTGLCTIRFAIKYFLPQR
jgi:hypothetical protein